MGTGTGPVLPEKIVRLKWNPAQSELFRRPETFVDFEGAIRAGKTKPALWYVIDSCLRHPGIKWMICRWDANGLAQLKPQFYENCPTEVLLSEGWHSAEEYQEFKNGSWVYIRSLKTQDESVRYSKLSGLNLSGILIDQAEEVPEDIWEAIKGRISQPGFPHKVIITPNPPPHDHWISKEFPEANTRTDHVYIRTTVYDNVANLGWEYVQRLEREYPPGHAMRRRWIDGERGLGMEGDPVYGDIFKIDLHIREVDLLPDFPLLESWDFGQRHPAVSWSQIYPWGAWRILGECMGSAQFIEDFVPQIAQRRTGLFPDHRDLLVCCDPAGADKSNQGLRYTAVEVLNEHLRSTYGEDCAARFVPGSNRMERREWAVQQIAGFMLRLTKHGPAMEVHPRCKIILEGFQGGYRYDKPRTISMQTTPNIRRPKKDGYYDHLQNTLEYVQMNFGMGQLSQRQIDRMHRRQLRMAQRDLDPDDRPSYIRTPVGRSGY